MNSSCALVLLLLLLPTPARAREDRDLGQLAGWLAGSFSSSQQAAADTNFFDIRLHITPIWTSSADARWFYVEQATAQQLDHPYRQRVYRLIRRDPKHFESAVFMLPSPQRFIGAWSKPAKLGALAPDSLVARDGCAVLLRRKGKRFTGGTQGQACASDLRGAAYATSEVSIGADGLVTLDRGFDQAGTQVWGSTHGGYRFEREREAAR